MSITSETRREAFESVDVPTMERKVLDILKAHGPLSAEEIMGRMGTTNPNNVRPRLSGLKKRGAVVAIGKKPNRNGRNETVWDAT